MHVSPVWFYRRANTMAVHRTAANALPLLVLPRTAVTACFHWLRTLRSPAHCHRARYRCACMLVLFTCMACKFLFLPAFYVLPGFGLPCTLRCLDLVWTFWTGLLGWDWFLTAFSPSGLSVFLTREIRIVPRLLLFLTP